MLVVVGRGVELQHMIWEMGCLGLIPVRATCRCCSLHALLHFCRDDSDLSLGSVEMLCK